MKNRVIETLVTARRTELTPMDQARTSTLLELITEGRSAQANPAGGVIVGKFAGFDDSGKSASQFCRGHFVMRLSSHVP